MPRRASLESNQANIDATLRKLPRGFFRSVVARLFAIEEERHLAVGKLSGPPGDLLDLMLGDAVRHDRDCWDAEVVEADHVVEAFNDDDAVTSDRLTIARFFEAARLLGEEFESTMKAFRERCRSSVPPGRRRNRPASQP